jgi:UDP-hydrolysing UDP-N-acetyl-D-glucosamine 2-epimerase
MTTIATVTGSRAEYGLLRSTMDAIERHDGLRQRVIVAGSHNIQPAETWREIAEVFNIDARVVMQRDDEPRDRHHDALSLARGIEAFAGHFAAMRPDCVLLLGDRIEPFAAASAASVMGIPVAHIHGGDRAEGVADEAMRHAITKLSHIHFPATERSGERLLRLGEDARHVHVVGSPAIDGLDAVQPMSDRDFEALGRPDTLLCLHPIGRSDEAEARDATVLLAALHDRRVLAMKPNLDAGREGIARALRAAERDDRVRLLEHLPRDRFVALCKTLASRGGVLIGNSSAGLIECSALRPSLPCVNIGPRQSGRERPASVLDVEEPTADSVAHAIDKACSIDRSASEHPYGDGRTGERIASLLAESGLADERVRAGLVRKRNAY